jgi:hypothetical protein
MASVCCAGLNVAVFLLWQINPQFAARNFMVSPQHIRDGRVYTLLTSGEVQCQDLDILSQMCAAVGLQILSQRAAAQLNTGGFQPVG